MAIELTINTDPGGANLSRVAGWLTTNLYKRYGANCKFCFRTDNGSIDAIKDIEEGVTDMGVLTPVEVANMACRGIGIYEGQAPAAHLRSIFCVPHDDEHVLAVTRESGLMSFDDVFDPKGKKVTIITAPYTGDSLMGHIFIKILSLYGKTIEQWEAEGGVLKTFLGPFEAFSAMQNGEADGLFFEAFMLRPWYRLADTIPLRFLSVPDKVARPLEQWGVPSFVLKPDGKRGFDEPIRVLQYAKFLVCCRDDMPDYIVRAITEIALDKSYELERDYWTEEPRYRAITLPITPQKLAEVCGVPMHPAAEAVYRQRGVID